MEERFKFVSSIFLLVNIQVLITVGGKLFALLNSSNLYYVFEYLSYGLCYTAITAFSIFIFIKIVRFYAIYGFNLDNNSPEEKKKVESVYEGIYESFVIMIIYSLLASLAGIFVFLILKIENFSYPKFTIEIIMALFWFLIMYVLSKKLVSKKIFLQFSLIFVIVAFFNQSVMMNFYSPQITFDKNIYTTVDKYAIVEIITPLTIESIISKNISTEYAPTIDIYTSGDMKKVIKIDLKFYNKIDGENELIIKFNDDRMDKICNKWIYFK